MNNLAKDKTKKDALYKIYFALHTRVCIFSGMCTIVTACQVMYHCAHIPLCLHEVIVSVHEAISSVHEVCPQAHFSL